MDTNLAADPIDRFADRTLAVLGVANVVFVAAFFLNILIAAGG